MAAVVQAIIVVALGLAGMGFFVSGLVTGTADILHAIVGLGLFALAWGYGMFRAT